MKQLLVLVLFLVFAACGAMERREGAGLVADGYASIVRPIVSIGIGAEQDAGRITAEEANELRAYAKLIGDVLDGVADPELGGPEAARSAWSALLPFVDSSIDGRVAAGDIGPGVAASLKESLRMFGERLLELPQ